MVAPLVWWILAGTGGIGVTAGGVGVHNSHKAEKLKECVDHDADKAQLILDHSKSSLNFELSNLSDYSEKIYKEVVGNTVKLFKQIGQEVDVRKLEALDAIDILPKPEFGSISDKGEITVEAVKWSAISGMFATAGVLSTISGHFLVLSASSVTLQAATACPVVGCGSTAAFHMSVVGALPSHMGVGIALTTTSVLVVAAGVGILAGGLALAYKGHNALNKARSYELEKRFFIEECQTASDLCHQQVKYIRQIKEVLGDLERLHNKLYYELKAKIQSFEPEHDYQQLHSLYLISRAITDILSSPIEIEGNWGLSSIAIKSNKYRSLSIGI
ncbi:hypothetical protein [Merismopedia glauca]|uniref:Uncharacterized protein n=1 Tax=Merismopedia glauca CCAP 1448/3 TaxID=1296344 RepID=A0A2T1CAS9_9CYAN|nr:hypothetical protein [Merismopedia glauca]PSB05268.1 hypothetical protein C7B64_00245 [Merismopedia glauca CCAP 1448/3]